MRRRSRRESVSEGFACLMLLVGAVFAASCAAFARSMMLAKPRLAGGAPFAVDGGVGEEVAPCFEIGLDVAF